MAEPPPSLLDGLPEGHFPCIHADVPWAYRVRSENGLGKSAEKHYRTMRLESIMRLDVLRHAASDAHLFFWVTGPFLAKGLHVPIMRCWGFEPSAIFGVWVKPTDKAVNGGMWICDDRVWKMGMGHTSRQNAEYVVIGRRGNPRRLRKDIRQIICRPLREHSRKPDEIYRRIEHYCDGPRLDLFGRAGRENWTVRGDETDKFD